LVLPKSPQHPSYALLLPNETLCLNHVILWETLNLPFVYITSWIAEDTS